MMNKVVGEKSPYLIHCHECETSTFLTEREYTHQMNLPNSTWQCPRCRMKDCDWDDDNYEEHINSLNKGVN